MAVERMELTYTTGLKNNIRKTAQIFVECGCLHPEDAVKQINRHMPLSGEQINGFTQNEDVYTYNDAYSKRVEELLTTLGIDKSFGFDTLDKAEFPENPEAEIEHLYNEISEYKSSLENCIRDLNDIKDLQTKIRDIKELKFPLNELKNLHYFNFKIGRVRKNSYVKIKENFENIPSIIYRINTLKEYIVIAAFTPVESLHETETILRSLGFEEINLPGNIGGVPWDILQNTKNSIDDIIQRKEHLEKRIASFKIEHEDYIKRCNVIVQMHKKQNLLVQKAAFTTDHYYIVGWVPKRCLDQLKQRINEISGNSLIVMSYQTIREKEEPPTKLRNHGFARPFEYFVRMYGLPVYSEIDPTLFVAITYMLMFGMMFGDIGQGFILLCGGLLINRRKKGSDFGGILVRIGASSMFFGVLYGSIFGNESLLHPVLIRPLDNINTMLIAGISTGIVLSIVSYIFNLVNMKRRRNIEEGLFGSEGAAGFLLYLILLISAVSFIYKGKWPLPVPFMAVIIIILFAAIILREPLTRLIQGRKPVPAGKVSDYYVESVFGLVEMLLGLFSKTVSFVRLGAFALNHGGLFLAFFALSQMTGSRGAGIAVMILGNIIIIGLEGLVVFIQGLRLEYFELFGRFFKGGGKEYMPIRATDKKGSVKK